MPTAGLFSPLDDELGLVVEEERDVLLRATIIVEGEGVSVREAAEIAFDEPIQPELFRPCAGPVSPLRLDVEGEPIHRADTDKGSTLGSTLRAGLPCLAL
jgi:hypothetical protein